MDVIRANRLIAAILGGLVVLVLIVIIAKAGGSSGPSLPASGGALDASTPAAGSASAVAEQFPRPNIEQLACRPLLTFEDIDPVLGTTEWLTISGGESCSHRLLADGDVFVRIWAGDPNDLIDGGNFEGAPGQPVRGVGAAAAWFGDASTLSVGAEGAFGILIFRITVSVPDLDEQGRLEAARTLAQSALPRFPGIEVEPPPPPEDVVVTIEHEPVDQSDQSYVANLLAREADGDWTRGEGLIATLRLFVGETNTSQVTPARTIAEQSATGIVRMARSYLESGASSEEAAELERLLGLLLPANVRSPEAAAGSRRSATQAIALGAVQEAPAGCVSVWPQHGDPCFMIADEIVPEFGDKYQLLFPDLDEWEGWVRGPSPISEAIRKTARFLEGLDGEAPPVDVILGPNQGYSVVLLEEGQCQIVLNRGAQILRDVDPALLQQAIASAMASCYLEHNFGYSENWELAGSYYLSDVVYPSASMETVVLKIPALLAGEELGTSLTERSLTNMAFFERVHSERGVEGAIAAFGAIVEGGPAAVDGIDDLLHEFAKGLTDGRVDDRAGSHPFAPGAQRFDASPGLRIKAEPAAFGLERVQLTVPSGMYGCMEYPDAGNLDLVVSWRPGSPGGGGGWSTSLPTDLQGTAVFLITAGEAEGRFDIRVDDVGEEPGCEEEEEDSNGDPGEPCGFCDPTSFYYDSFGDWMNVLAGRG